MPSEAKVEWIEGWAQFLKSYEWQGFWTLTTREEYTFWAFQRAILKWGETFTVPSPTMPSFVFFLERSKMGLYHSHGLTRNEKCDRVVMWKDWFKRNGRARSEAYNSALGARYYCSKYITKETGEAIVDLRRSLQYGF